MEDERSTFRYIRPTSDAQTCHLLLGGQEEELLRVKDTLIKLGAVNVTSPAPPLFTHCFCSFQTPADASNAAAIISDPATYGKIIAKFADATMEKPRPHQQPQPHVLAVESAEECNIPGLSLLLDFVTVEEESALLAEVDTRPWNSLARRKVQHYGRPFNYLARTVDRSSPTDPFPPKCNAFLSRISALPHVQGPLDQLTINDYPLGIGISPHIETHSAFNDTIAALSLGSSAVMIFRRTITNSRKSEDKGEGEGECCRESGNIPREQKALVLPPRSLLIMTGEARLAWAHYIPHRRTDYSVGGRDLPRGPRRVSFTYRKVREKPCTCAYPALCDNQEGSIPPTRMAEKKIAAMPETTSGEEKELQERCYSSTAQSLEDSNVNNVYNAIAPHFSATRFAIWPAVRHFIENITPGGIVADVGCGNGKYFAVRKDLFTAGSDRSEGLAKVAARRLFPAGLPVSEHPRADVVVADGLKLPYRESSCDAVLCIAVVHHMASVKRRISFLEGLLKILVLGGKAIVTVWATEQENMKKVAKWEPLLQTEDGEEGRNDYLVPWHLPMHRVEAMGAAQSAAEAAVDTGKNALVFRRYYHLFEPGELEGLVEQVPGAAVVKGFYDKDNWCVVFQREF
ncbi:hypothetical protein Ndes2437B_g01611 [Nannochloris sp. 'desiccata']